MAAFDGNIIIGTNVDVGGINTGLNKISNSLRRLTGSNPLVNLFKDAASAASDLVEVQNIVDVTFEDLAFKAERFANVAIKQFGMSRLSAKETAGSFMAMGRAMDLDTETASNMAVQLAALSGDFSSFYNTRQEYARVALSAVYTGETETLKRYGVVLTQANLQQFAMSKGIDANVKSMSARDKLILRYMYVMENLDFIQGDFVRTQDSWANQTRQLNQNWKELLIVLGNGVTTVLSPMIGVLNEIVFALQRFIKVILIIIGNIYGISFDDLSNDMNGYSDSVGEAADKEADLADAIKGSAKAAKKALAPFDELNVIRTASGSGSGGTSNIFGDFEIPDITGDWLGEAEEKLSSLIDTMYDFGRFLSTTFENLLKKIPWGEVFDIARKVGKDISDFLNGLFSPSMFGALGRTIANGLNTIIYAIQMFVHNLDWSQIGDSLGTFINNLFRTFDWNAFADTINTGVEGFWEFVGAAIEKTDWKLIRDSITNFLEQIDWEVWATLIGAAVLAILTSKTVLNLAKKGISNLFAALLPAIGRFISSIDFVGLLASIGPLLRKGFLKLLGITISPIDDVFGSGLPGPIANKIFTLNPKIVKAWDTLKTIFIAIGKFFKRAGSVLFQMNTLDLGAIFSQGTAVEIGATIGAGLIEGIIAAFAGFEFGKNILGPLLSPDDKSWYEEFSFFGDDGFFKTIIDNFDSLGEALSRMFSDEDGIAFYMGGIVTPILEFKELIENIKTGNIDGISDALIKLGVSVTDLLVPPMTIVNLLLNRLVSDEFKDRVKNFVSEVVLKIIDIKTNLSNLHTWLKDVISSLPAIISSTVVTVLGKVTKLWEGLKTGAKNCINNIIGFFEKFINGVIDNGLNKFLSGFNSLANTLAQASGNTWTDIGVLKHVSIPRLAKGAVIPPNSPFLAMLGDQRSGTNIEAPLDTIKQALAEVLSIAGGVGGDIHVHVDLDGREIAKAVVKQNTIHKKSTGRSLI